VLVAIEPRARRLVRGAVHARIGHAREPVRALLRQIRVIEERAAVDEILAEIPDGPLHFAFGLRPVRPAGAWREAPMVGKPQELEVVHECPTLQPEVSRDHRPHLIEQQLLRHAAEREEGLLQAGQQRPHVLAWTEVAP
jgi:hypothetical protein